MIENKNQGQERNQDNLNDEMAEKQAPSRQDQTRQNQGDQSQRQGQQQSRSGQQSEGVRNPSTNR